MMKCDRADGAIFMNPFVEEMLVYGIGWVKPVKEERKDQTDCKRVYSLASLGRRERARSDVEITHSLSPDGRKTVPVYIYV